jgi:hypothetical protein
VLEFIQTVGWWFQLFNPEKQLLVGGIPTPLKNMSSSVGMMTFQIYYMEIHKIHVPNRQPG